MRRHRETAQHAAWREAHYSAADINDKLIINLRDLNRTMQFLYEGRGSQKRILIILEELGGSATQRELTERLGIQPGSASEVIAKLESTGSIKRTPHETDRRTVDVALTEAGRSLAAEAKDLRIRRHAQMFSCLVEGEKQQLLSLLEKVNANWEAFYHSGDESHGPCGCPQAHHHHGHGKCQRGE